MKTCTRCCAAAILSVVLLAAAHQPLSAGDLLICGTSISDPLTEWQIAQSQGHNVLVSCSWDGLTTEQFSTFNAIVIGDEGCPGNNFPTRDPIDRTKAQWSPAVTGPQVVIGGTPVRAANRSAPSSQAVDYIRNGINFAAGGSKTGLYVGLGCHFRLGGTSAQVDFLSGLGNFEIATIALPACNSVAITEPSQPVMAGLTDAGLSDWNCSADETFLAFPSSLIPIATAGGEPFILASGRGASVLVDPVPDLLNGPAVTTDTEQLATMGQEVEGVAADGVARVIVRIPAQQAMERFMVTLLNDSGQLSLSPEEDGGLTNTGEDRDLARNTVFATAEDTTQGTEAFAVYHSPIDFPRADGRDADAAERSVTIRIQSLDSGAAPEILSVRIVRPPVFLIHGLWSQASAWGFFSPLVPGGAGRFFVQTLDYEDTNSQSILTNASIILARATDAVSQFKVFKQVAAVQFDGVAHSMGGLIIRAMLVDPMGLRDDNFLKGDVHKLITVGTPHWGTPLATALIEATDELDELTCTIFLELGEIQPTIAVADLQEGSSIIAELATRTDLPIHAHAIVGLASSQQTTTVNRNARELNLSRACPTLFPLGSSMFGEPSDLVVGQHSQNGAGLAISGGDPPATSFNNTIHTVDPKLFNLGPDELSRIIVGEQKAFSFTGIPERVIELLNEPMAGQAFAQIKP